jgi:hypothetical protein
VGRVLYLLWRTGQIFTTNSSYQITHCTNLKYFLWEKNIIATKMNETAEWLVLYEELSHFPVEITPGFTCKSQFLHAYKCSLTAARC